MLYNDFMRFLCVFAVLVCFAVSAQAESYYDQVIRQKQEAAVQKRAEVLRNVQARQADPEGYIKAKYASTEAGTSSGTAEKFNVSGDGHYYVPVSINNKTVNFMADTGATGIFLSQSDAKKVGINPMTLQYNQRYITANGATGRAAMANAKILKVGSIEMRDVPVIVSMEREHIALLGMEFFSRLKRYEVSNGEMSLYK